MQLAQTVNRCQVCGDYALIVNYGALTCLPCRTFFRRNAKYSNEIRPCRYGGQCPMNIITRKFCPSCRLNKCFTIGMNTELFRKEDFEIKKRKFSQLNNEDLPIMKIPQESALDRPSDEIYITLSGSDRILISNVIHAYDKFSTVPQIRLTMEFTERLTSKCKYDSFHSIQLVSSCRNSVQLFMRSIPDFKILTLNEQRSLLLRNFIGTFCAISLSVIYESGLFNKPETQFIFSILYGEQVTQQLKHFIRQIICDPVLIKLGILALAFSANCYAIDYSRDNDQDSLLLGTFRLLGSQNVYVEVLWTYLVHTYGFKYSVKIFSSLIKQYLNTFSLSMEAYTTNQFHHMVLDTAIHRIKTSLIVEDDVKIPVWGKRI